MSIAQTWFARSIFMPRSRYGYTAWPWCFLLVLGFLS